MVRRMCTKKQVAVLKKLGYRYVTDSVTMEDALDFFMKEKNLYVMPYPVASRIFPYYRWKVRIVVLEKPNTYQLLRAKAQEFEKTL